MAEDSRVFKHDLEVPKSGGGFRYTFTFYQEDGVTLLDISGWTIEAKIATKGAADAGLITLTVGNGGVVIDESTASIVLTSTQINNIPTSPEWQMVCLDSLDELYARIEGSVKVVAQRIG